jgi:hypothetical protein
MVTNLSHANKIDTGNGDLAIAITKVIIDNKILIEKNLILSVDLFMLILNKTYLKTVVKERCVFSPYYHQQTHWRRRKKDP